MLCTGEPLLLPYYLLTVGIQSTHRLLDNLPTNQLADWSTCGLVNLLTAIFLKHEKTTLYLYTDQKQKDYTIGAAPPNSSYF